MWEHVNVWFKHHACWRPESCVGACKDVVSTPCLLEARVMCGSMLMCGLNTMPAGGQSHVWEHVKVYRKTVSICLRAESCIIACKGVVTNTLPA